MSATAEAREPARREARQRAEQAADEARGRALAASGKRPERRCQMCSTVFQQTSCKHRKCPRCGSVFTDYVADLEAASPSSKPRARAESPMPPSGPLTIMITPAAGVVPATLAEAVAEVQRLEEEARGHLQSIRERQKDLVRNRFAIGRIVDAVSTSASYGQGAVARLAEGTGISESQLYECRRFFDLPQFAQSTETLEAWITETEERKGAVNWSYARNLVRGQLPDEPEARQAKVKDRVRRLERRAEGLEQDAEDLRLQLDVLPDDERDEAEGAASKAAEVASDLRAEVGRLKADAALAGPGSAGTPRDPAYLAHVGSYRCCACREAAGAPVLLLGPGGSDYSAVPLCPTHERELAATTRKGFEREHEVELWRVVADLLSLYYNRTPLS